MQKNIPQLSSALVSTFQHLPFIGKRKEARLLAEGICTWQHLLEEMPRHFPLVQRTLLEPAVYESISRWHANDVNYFASVLPASELWRLIESCHSDIAYLDIEATGNGMPPLSASTAVSFLFRGTLYQEYDYVRKRAMVEEITSSARAICTYNGAAYDLPFLRQEFLLPIDLLHIDLCPWLRRQGFRGGLKAIQYGQVHLHQRNYPDVNGYDAVRLWSLHEQGIPGALDALLTYNAEDVLVLPGLLRDAYHREIAARPHLNLPSLPDYLLPELKTRIDCQIYQLLRAKTSADVCHAVDYLKL